MIIYYVRLKLLLSKARKNFSAPEYKKFYTTIKTLKLDKDTDFLAISHIEALINIFPEFDTVFVALFIQDHYIPEETKVKLLNKKQQELLKKYEEAVEFDTMEKGKRSALMHFLFTAFIDDVRVIYFFLARRLIIAKSHASMSPEVKIREGKQLMEVVAPLAHRMGIHSLKEEFENLSFQILFPEEYTTIEKQEKEYTLNKQSFFKRTNENFEKIFKNNSLNPILQHRVKNLYSVFKKMQIKGKSTIEDIHDVFAMRVITDTQANCYKIFGLLHSAYHHLPGKIKDYISMPKANAYQSLHTILFLPFNDEIIPLEVQIRTEQMHRVSEEGVASHMLYKENGEDFNVEQGKKQVKKKLQAIRSHFSEETFLRSTSKDLFSSRIFVFTKDGDIKSFPQGATVLDFAYSVHSNIGNCCTGAIINGYESEINSPLRHLDNIEITIASSPQVQKKWSQYCITPVAQKGIRLYIRNHEQEDN